MTPTVVLSWYELLLFIGLIVAAVQFLMGALDAPSWTWYRSADPLDRPLLRWSKRDALTSRMFLTGGISILGRSSSGKSRASGRYIAYSLILPSRKKGSLKPSGGIIFADKVESLSSWRQLFAAAGRSEDLVEFSPHSHIRLNFLDYAFQLNDDPRTLVEFLQILSRGAKGKDRRDSGEHGSFWKNSEERLLYNAIVVLLLARNGKLTAQDLQQFVTTSASSPDQLKDLNWVAGFHSQMLEAAHQADKTPLQQDELNQAIAYWLGEAPAMAPATRSGIFAGVLNTLHVFNTGLVKSLVCGDSNFDLQQTLQGKYLYVNFPPSHYGVTFTFLYSGLKYLMQRTVLQRHVQADDGLHVIWVDEAAQHSNEFDILYLQECRSRRGGMVYLSQGVKSYHAAFGGQSGADQANALLNCFGSWVVHACDPDTAEAASRRLGKRRETFFSSSLSADEYEFHGFFPDRTLTHNYSQSYEPILQEQVFMGGLRTGGPANRHCSDAIILKLGEPFANGENWLLCSFSTK